MLYKTRRLYFAKEKISAKPFNRFIKIFRHWLSFPHDFDKNRRNRIYTVFETFWLFLYQVLSYNGSCQYAVSKAISFLAIKTSHIPSPNNGSYCKARMKLSLKAIKEILCTLIRRSQQEIRQDQLWYGKQVKVVDGTTCTLADTPKNQKAFPQPESQKPGCGFPMIRIVALFSLAMGTVLKWRKGAYRESERTLFRSLIDSLEENDVLLGDRGMGSYMDFLFLMKRGVNFVIRVSKKNRKQIIKKFGKKDHLVRWLKPLARPRWVDKETWRSVPSFLLLREVSYCIDSRGFRTNKVTVVTNLVDQRTFPSRAFQELYYRRWKVELYFRDIKTTLGMDRLSCKTPDMVKKEILMHLIAYNLIRMMMFQSGQIHKTSVEEMSFKGTVNLFLQFIPYFELSNNDERGFVKILSIFYQAIARLKKPWRPNRREPRAVKRRPKRYQYLTQSRNIFKEDPHRGKRPYS